MADPPRTKDNFIQVGDVIINVNGTQYKILKISEQKIEGEYRIYEKTEIKITTPSGEDFTVKNVLEIGVVLEGKNDVPAIRGLYIASRIPFEPLQKARANTFGEPVAPTGPPSSNYINNGDVLVGRDGNNIKIIKIPSMPTESRGRYRTYDNIHIKITRPSGEEVFEDKTLFMLSDSESATESEVEHTLRIYPRIYLLQFSFYKNITKNIDVTNRVDGSRIYTEYRNKRIEDINSDIDSNLYPVDIPPTLPMPSMTSTKTFKDLFSDFYDASTMYKVERYLLKMPLTGIITSSKTFAENLQSIINAELMEERPIVYKIKHIETGDISIYLLLEADTDGYMYYSADGSSFKEGKLSLHEMITRWNSMKYFYYVYRCPYNKVALKQYFLPRKGSGASASNSSASNSSASNSSSSAAVAAPTSVVNPLAVVAVAAVKPSTPTSVSATATSVVNPLAVAASSAGAEPPKPCKNSSCSVQGGSRKKQRKSRRHKSKKRCGRSRKTIRKTH
jgi:hypothetical protein